jgi:MFS family permease
MTIGTVGDGPRPAVAARVLAGCGLVSFLSLPTLHIFPFGVFAIAIANSNGWPAQQVAATIGPALLLANVAYPVNGWIIQRFHKPTIAVLAQAAAALGLCMLAFAPSDLQVFRWVLIAAVLLSTLTNPAITSVLICEHFDRRRGLALGIVMACTGIGVALLPVIAAKLIGIWGWRTAYGVLAAATLTASIANVFLLGSAGRQAVAQFDEPVRRTGALAEAIREPTFWIIAALFFTLAAAANVVPIHLPLILKARGSSAQVGALGLTVIGLSMIVSRPVVGYLIDRLPIRAVLTIMLAGPLIGSASLFLTSGATAALLSAGGFGLAIGGEFVCLGYIISRGFALSSFSVIFGWLAFATGAGQALGSMAISALVAKSGGNYASALLLVVIAALAALGLGLCLKDSRFRPKDGAVAPPLIQPQEL